MLLWISWGFGWELIFRLKESPSSLIVDSKSVVFWTRSRRVIFSSSMVSISAVWVLKFMCWKTSVFSWGRSFLKDPWSYCWIWVLFSLSITS